MPLNIKKDDMGDVIKDFYKSKAPQFKGKSKEKRRQMAIAAKLEAERGPLDVDEACWKGYEKKGMKTMFGKRYPNCVKKKKTKKMNEEMNGKCKAGYYYCYTDKKCKPIPKGFRVVGPAGMLRKENGHTVDDDSGTKNGNGNGKKSMDELLDTVAAENKKTKV